MFKSGRLIRQVRYERYSNRNMSILILPTQDIFFKNKTGSITIKKR